MKLETEVLLLEIASMLTYYTIGFAVGCWFMVAVWPVILKLGLILL